MGGDMGAWSDIRDPGASRGVAALVAPIVSAKKPRRVLLLGPVASLLLPLVPQSTQVEVVVRGRLDAQSASDLGGLHRELRIVCGGFDRYEPVEPFDLIVALGGPQRVIGFDTPGISYAAMTQKLVGMLADSGVMVLDGWNEVGVHQQLSTSPREQRQELNENWVVGAEGFDRRDLYLGEFENLLQESGLTIAKEYGVFPDPELPWVFAARQVIDGRAPHSFVTQLTARSVAHAYSDQPVLVEPVGYATRMLEAGLGFQLAAGWLAIAGRGDALQFDAPDIVHCESGMAYQWARVTTVGVGENAKVEVKVAWANGSTDVEVSEGDIQRTIQPVNQESGVLLQDELREACAGGRHEPIRDLIRRYYAWLKDEASWQQRGNSHKYFAVPDNVTIRNDGSLELFDPSWTRSIELTVDNAFVHGVRDFARKLLASASPHPWRSSISADELTRTLASMVGVGVSGALVDGIAEQEVAAELVVSGRQATDSEELEEWIIRNREATATGLLTPAATAVGYRELFAHDRQMSRAVNTMEAQIGWLEGTMKLRDRRIRELEAQIARIERTMMYQAGRAMGAPRRMATTMAMDRAVDSVPPSIRDRALRAARRLAKPEGQD